MWTGSLSARYFTPWYTERIKVPQLASYVSVITGYSCIHAFINTMMMHPTGLPKEYRNIIHYFVPVHICGNYYCIICCNYVAQLPKTKVKKKRLEKNVFILYRENGWEELCTNAVSMSKLTETDFQRNIFKSQHSWAAAWTSWKRAFVT